VLFIADEVMTAWGRTGNLLACEQANIVPDILCLSKGLTGGSLPLAVTMATPEIFAAHYSADRALQFFHSSSYTANPIACAAANANLAIWREEPVFERISKLAEWQAAGLMQLARHSAITNPRQLGTIIAVDVTAKENGYLSELGPHLKAAFTAQNILLRPLGNSVYVMPPYCTEENDLRRVYDSILHVIDEL
jgi:adenosylmethionine-8-amino-7-oxononanoate aminotransferase